MSHFFLLLFAAALAASAAEVSLETAGEAAQAWVDGGYSLGTMRGRCAASSETVEADGAKVHVVRFKGGGFVAMGADDLVDPVIAFSPSGTYRADDERSPLRAILAADLAQRSRAAARQAAAAESAKSGRTLLGAAASASSRTESQRRWDRLLGRVSSGAGLLKSSASSAPLEAVSDVRVEPLVKSRWSQGNNSMYINYGEPCFNYYTPNNYPCGCVATAMAQIMRYHRYPASGAVVTNKCGVGTESSKNFTTKGGTYDYDSMPLVPEAYETLSWYEGGATEAQREAIGRLTYDCGVMMQMRWKEGGSSSGGPAAGNVLKTTNMFKYRNAVVNTCTTNLTDDSLRNRMIYPNLDAGMPVMLGLVEHQVIADGYGYSDGTLYTHLNMGWADECDVWYALPDVYPTVGDYSSSVVEAVIYNIFPTQTGEVVSGRILSSDGFPVEGASVSIRDSANTAVMSNVVTGVRGMFAFIVPSGRTYVIDAAWGEAQASAQFSTGTSASSAVTLSVGSYTIDNSTSKACGNAWGYDLALPGVRTAAAPEFEPGGCEFRRSTNVVITCATSDAAVRYTTDGSVPTLASPSYRAPITIEHRTVLKARAFRSGFNPSPVVAAEYFDPLEGDLYEQPILISGTNGVHTVADNTGFSRETNEPYITGYAYYNDPSYYPNHYAYDEYNTCWYRWKSPGTGKMTFKFSGVMQNNFYIYPAVAVYEDASSLSAIASLPLSVDIGRYNNYAYANVTVPVKAGKIYRIVGLQWYKSTPGTVTLSWKAEPGFVIPPPPLSIRIR